MGFTLVATVPPISHSARKRAPPGARCQFRAQARTKTSTKTRDGDLKSRGRKPGGRKPGTETSNPDFLRMKQVFVCTPATASGSRDHLLRANEKYAGDSCVA